MPRGKGYTEKELRKMLSDVLTSKASKMVGGSAQYAARRVKKAGPVKKKRIGPTQPKTTFQDRRQQEQELAPWLRKKKSRRRSK